MGNTLSYNVSETDLDLGSRGSIKGLQYDSKARRYAGVPYALPPIGEHRWKKPRPLPSTHVYQADDGSPYDATSFKPACWQELPAALRSVAKAEGDETEFSEDCLLLNIWTPVPKPGEQDKKWPVVVWLHGGWFAMGNASQEAGMDPTELISTAGLDAIFVAVGYRLNVFGFLASSALLEESSGEAAGNFGLLDMRLALEWVRDNIHHFGGDASNVTLGGRSAGAYAAEAQVLYELRRPDASIDSQLFKRFYMISNAIPAQPKTVAECEPQFEEVCSYFKIAPDLSGAEKLRRLRAISASELVSAQEHLKHHTFRPVTDDIFIHSGIIEYQTSGAFARDFQKRDLRLLIGEVLNEETLYAQYNPPTTPDVESLRSQVANYYAPATVDRILPSYDLPKSDDLEEWKRLYGNIIADGQVRAPSRFLVKNLSDHGVPVERLWRYQIQYRCSFITEKVAPASFGVAHAMDKPLWK